MPMSSRKTFATNSYKDFFCGMYGFSAKSSIPRLNILRCTEIQKYRGKESVPNFSNGQHTLVVKLVPSEFLCIRISKGNAPKTGATRQKRNFFIVIPKRLYLYKTLLASKI